MGPGPGACKERRATKQSCLLREACGRSNCAPVGLTPGGAASRCLESCERNGRRSMHVGRVLFRRAAISQIDTGLEWSARRSDAQPPWVPRLCKNRTVGMRETSGKLVPLSHRAPVSARDRTGSEKELSGFKVRMLRLFRTTVGLCWERGRRRGCARCGQRSSRPPSSPENGPKVTYQPSLMTLAGGGRVCLAISRAKPWRGNARESDSLVRRRVLECLLRIG